MSYANSQTAFVITIICDDDEGTPVPELRQAAAVIECSCRRTIGFMCLTFDAVAREVLHTEGIFFVPHCCSAKARWAKVR